jgi:hypothetical protein
MADTTDKEQVVLELSHTRVVQRSKGPSLLCACCQYPIALLLDIGKSRSTASHGKEIHATPLTAEDHRKIADLLDEMEENCSTMQSDQNERAA